MDLVGSNRCHKGRRGREVIGRMVRKCMEIWSYRKTLKRFEELNKEKSRYILYHRPANKYRGNKYNNDNDRPKKKRQKQNNIRHE